MVVGSPEETSRLLAQHWILIRLKEEAYPIQRLHQQKAYSTNGFEFLKIKISYNKCFAFFLSKSSATRFMISNIVVCRSNFITERQRNFYNKNALCKTSRSEARVIQLVVQYIQLLGCRVH